MRCASAFARPDTPKPSRSTARRSAARECASPCRSPPPPRSPEMRNPCLLATAALTALWASTAIATDGDALSEVKRQLQQGVDHGDVAQVLEARARFQVLVEIAPRSALPAYWVAVADWRAAALLLNGAHPNREQARRHCEAG